MGTVVTSSLLALKLAPMLQKLGQQEMLQTHDDHCHCDRIESPIARNLGSSSSWTWANSSWHIFTFICSILLFTRSRDVAMAQLFTLRHQPFANGHGKLLSKVPNLWTSVQVRAGFRTKKKLLFATAELQPSDPRKIINLGIWFWRFWRFAVVLIIFHSTFSASFFWPSLCFTCWISAMFSLWHLCTMILHCQKDSITNPHIPFVAIIGSKIKHTHGPWRNSEHVCQRMNVAPSLALVPPSWFHDNLVKSMAMLWDQWQSCEINDSIVKSKQAKTCILWVNM